MKLVGKSAWWLILLLIPFVGFVTGIIVTNELSRSFGKGGAFTLGLIFLGFIFFPILGFGADPYFGPGGLVLRGQRI
jgi:uncharacterized membrane protein YoaK (UPF0700 family)